MFKKDLIIPALVGLGIYSQDKDLALNNNTIMLLLMYILFEDHQSIQHIERELHPYGLPVVTAQPRAYDVPYYNGGCNRCF